MHPEHTRLQIVHITTVRMGNEDQHIRYMCAMLYMYTDSRCYRYLALRYTTCDIDPVPFLLVDNPDTRHPVPGDVPTDHYHRAILETNGYHAHVLVSTHGHHLGGVRRVIG